MVAIWELKISNIVSIGENNVFIGVYLSKENYFDGVNLKSSW